MWKTFQHEDKLYMLKIIYEEDLELYLTDLQNLWIQKLSKEAVLLKFQECNPLFDIKIDEAVAEVVELINQIAEAGNLILSTNGDELQLSAESEKSEVKIKFQFDFIKSTQDMFLKEVTVPLIQTVKHLEACQSILCNLVKKKDRELEEYKLEKGLISRDDLITERFDDAMLNNIDDKSMMNVFGQSKPFWDSFTRQYGTIETKIEDIKMDPWNHMKRKRKVYSAKTAIKKGKGINYDKEKSE
ncbi:hypothetical protein Zmor_001672 [Zophobas morio]|uniref:Non-homologous end-joining factor 1 n=1 Tax=Zophobas morio TaxID=2755281 RepID=A0AA38MSL5_9CUCU|nr:hypothetical protein Zmor_001672 [Zophobas morio]